MAKKVMIVLGTRPEAIKLAPLVLGLKNGPTELEAAVVTTAQHRELLDQVLDLFEIRPDHDLRLMRKNQSPQSVLALCLDALGPVIASEKPDLIVAQGDTTTTLGAALAAFYHKIPLGHVEAGLRTGERYSPYPEEMNRKVTTAIADLHFAPTERSRRNLLAEGVAEESVVVTGNTVVDALLWAREKVRAQSQGTVRGSIAEIIGHDRRVVLVTGHRRENFGPGLENVCIGLKRLAERNPGISIVYPAHLNPQVQEPVGRILSNVPNIHAVKPVDYATFVWLMERCHFIISDSGGIQEEAPSLGKPVLVTREVTERPEAVEVGAVKLIGTSERRLVMESEKLLHDRKSYDSMVAKTNPFGDGRASERIIEVLARRLGVA